jgi:hypothetical protein
LEADRPVVSEIDESGPENNPPDEANWAANYFNYFTEIEEHFQRARATSLFLLSPLDWALIESWKNSGVPLEAVIRGIDDAFEKWRVRKIKTRRVNSLAYCTQAVMENAKRLSGAGATRARQTAESPFEIAEIQEHLERAAALLSEKQTEAYTEMALSLRTLAGEAEAHAKDLEDLERRLTALEEKMVAVARSRMSDDALLTMRRQLDSDLSPYRGKMTADQISMLERRYLDTRVLQEAGLPRLSLFYMEQ